MKNPNLDFAEFAAKIIKSVDDIRSFGGATKTSPTSSSSRPTESRINAFYRLLGLPSAIPGNTDATWDLLNTGNQFDATKLRFADDTEMTNKQTIRESSFLNPITSEEARNFIHSNSNKLDDGIQVQNNKSVRIRGSLFPMVVFGEVPVFPQDRRVAEAFWPKEDRKVEDTEYRVPFIESVVYIRLKGQGVIDANLQKQLESDFQISAQNLNVLEVTILNAIATSSNTIIERLTKVTAALNDISKQMSAHQLPTVNLVAEVRQEFDSTSVKAGAIEQREAKESARAKLHDAMLFIMEYAKDGTHNMQDSAILSEIMSLVGKQSSDSRKNEVSTVDAKNKKDIQISKEKVQKRARAAFRELEFLLGTFGGLSGVDVMVIIEALFSIKIEELIGLLNNNSKSNLKKIKGNVNTNVSVADALEALEAKVTQVYQRIMASANAKKHKDKLSNKE